MYECFTQLRDIPKYKVVSAEIEADKITMDIDRHVKQTGARGPCPSLAVDAVTASLRSVQHVINHYKNSENKGEKHDSKQQFAKDLKR